ncbi:MAG: hypothetical protein A2287_03275 [Candidatus Melainabacteria bacterium RIFOXYA12_FULL_32_12]|nr:MAG: hypothetical protein A2255_06115 [Candidatus Melainabacteria bacterium RIFOXYA2_FULL_32_9]OGI30522.1 MAG: hypothetical protein A2287_03275 [Candidatus Melainabacteria bacterium RIFOXYA12_FULL_32_12]
MAFIRKTSEEKEQKQLEMVKLETKYEQFLSKKISEKRNVLLSKYPEIKTLFEGWLYGVYITILDVQQIKERKGKLYYLFENIPESTNKYKLTYTIDDKNNCVFNVSMLKNFPKSYLSIFKRHNFSTDKEETTVSELIVAHIYKLDETVYIHHSDYNKLNNGIKNLVPLEKDFFYGLSDDEQKNMAKSQQYIPEKYKAKPRKKPKDVVKMEYRACDLYYNHKIPVEKIAATLRNRLNKAAIQRIVKLYPYFRVYCIE